MIFCNLPPPAELLRWTVILLESWQSPRDEFQFMYITLGYIWFYFSSFICKFRGKPTERGTHMPKAFWNCEKERHVPQVAYFSLLVFSNSRKSSDNSMPSASNQNIDSSAECRRREIASVPSIFSLHWRILYRKQGDLKFQSLSHKRKRWLEKPWISATAFWYVKLRKKL